MNRFRLIILVVFSLVSVSQTFAQVSFEATTDAKQLGAGDIFELKFTLKNGQGTGFSPPDLRDFTVVSGPNRMNSMTIVNGNASNSEAITYTLQAQREGNFTIGAATVSLKGKTLRTDPLSILVTKGKRQTLGSSIGDAKKGVIVRAEASTTTGFLGQQIIVDYKLYTRVDINGMNLVREPKYDGFYFLDVNDYPHGENRVKIAGKSYVLRILRRVALFPQREGAITIDPMTVQVGIVKDKVLDPFEDPFFSSFKSENAMVVSDPLTINVKPLPLPSPTDFSGAVGSFTAEAILSKTEGTTDDAFSLKLKVVGNGDAKRWLAPKLLAIDGLEFYDPKTVREENIEQQGEWQTVKEFDYLIVPKKAGEYTFAPSFFYLNTETDAPEFKNLLNQTFTLRIAQGKSQTAVISSERRKDILPIKMATFFTDRVTWFMGSSLFWALVLLPFIFIGGILGYKKILIQTAQMDKTVLRSQNASKIAEGRLRVAADFMKKGNTRLFYDEISKSLTRYISDKLGLPMSDFSKANVGEKLKELSVNDLNRESFVRILQDCELALFAGQGKDAAEQQNIMQKMYDDTLATLSAIETDLKA